MEKEIEKDMEIENENDMEVEVEEEDKDRETEKLYEDISPENRLMEVESVCMNCEESGVTKILLTKIPFFKEIILMCFECPHCLYQSREIKPGQELSDYGITYEVNMISARDLSRRIVKSEFATIKFPGIDLEIPPKTQKGKLTTIEGFLLTTEEALSKALEEKIYFDMGGEELENKIKEMVQKIKDTIKLKNLPQKFFLEDPGGNSFVENPYAPNTDQNCKKAEFKRSREQMIEMGFLDENSEEAQTKTEVKVEEDKKVETAQKFGI